MKPELTPEQFFREQMNGGATTIGELVGKLCQYDTTTISNMLLCLRKDLTEAKIKDWSLPWMRPILQEIVSWLAS